MWRELGPVKLWGVLYGVSILSFFLVSYLVARRLRLRRRVWIALSLSYLIGMTTGAKALYDVQKGEFSIGALFSLDHYLAAGLWGGVLAYLILALPMALILALRKRAALDLIALALPIPLFFTKVGCLLNGCCHGTVSSMPWALTFPEGAATAPPGIAIHPTQAYELLVIALIFVVFTVLDDERWRGTMLLWFLVVYGFGRATTELFRADLQDRGYTLGLFSLSQILCIAAACASVVVLYGQRGHTRFAVDSEGA